MLQTWNARVAIKFFVGPFPMPMTPNLNPTERLPWYHKYLVSSREVTSTSLCFPKLSYSIVVLLWEDISFLVHPPEPSHHHFVWSSVSQRFYIVNICLASSHQYKNLQNAKMIIILMVIAVWKVTLVINCFWAPFSKNVNWGSPEALLKLVFNSLALRCISFLISIQLPAKGSSNLPAAPRLIHLLLLFCSVDMF